METEQLVALCEGLTPKQRDFVFARANTNSDVAATAEGNVSIASVPKWKHEARFKPAYDMAVSMSKQALADDKRIELPVIVPGQVGTDKQQVMSQQIDLVTAVLPTIVAENIRLALQAPKDVDKLKAMQVLYSILNFDSGNAMPVSKQNKVYMTMLNMLQPQIAAEAAKRGLPANTKLIDLISGEGSEEGEEDSAE